MYAFREREKILDLFEALTGSRMMCNYMRFGGCRVDCRLDGWSRRKKWLRSFPVFLMSLKSAYRQRDSSGAHPGDWRVSKELAIQEG